MGFEPMPATNLECTSYEVTATPIWGKGLKPLNHCSRVFDRAKSHNNVGMLKPPIASIMLISASIYDCGS